MCKPLGFLVFLTGAILPVMAYLSSTEEFHRRITVEWHTQWTVLSTLCIPSRRPPFYPTSSLAIARKKPDEDWKLSFRRDAINYVTEGSIIAALKTFTKIVDTSVLSMHSHHSILQEIDCICCVQGWSLLCSPTCSPDNISKVSSKKTIV